MEGIVIGLFFIFLSCFKPNPERWESGLIHQFAKLTYSIRVPGVRIPPSPQSKATLGESRGFFICPGVESLLS